VVVVPRERIDKVKAALASVESNGQAVAACDVAIKAAADLAKLLRNEGGSIRQGGAKDLDAYAERVKTARKALVGNAAAAVGASWAKAKEQVLNLYMLVFVTEFTEGAGREFGDRWSDALKSSVDDLPKTIGQAAKVTMAAVNTVVTEAAKVGGSLAWGMVAGAWPLFLVAGVGLFGYFWLKKKIPVIP
jgi:hypothetical protein